MKYSNFNGTINKSKKQMIKVLKSGVTIKSIVDKTYGLGSKDYVDGSLQLFAVERLIKKKEINVYIESNDLLDFLSETTINKSSIANLKKMVVESLGSESSSTYAIHLPNKSNSILLHVELFNTGNFLGLNSSGQFFSSLIMVRDDYGYFKFDGLPWDKNHISDECDTKTEWKICLNFLMYISAFPEMLVNESPSIAMIRPQGASKTLKETCGISNYLKDDVSPHFRRGHFRVLRHERFGENKMKSVYVKPCFVGHNSVTLIS